MIILPQRRREQRGRGIVVFGSEEHAGLCLDPTPHMAIDLHLKNNCSCSPPPPPVAAVTTTTSMPFSRDLSHSHEGAADQETFDGSPSSDFDFCVPGESCTHEPTTADELFYDGKLLPLPIHPRNQTNPFAAIRSWVPPAAVATPSVRKERLMDVISQPHDDDEENEKPVLSPKPSFWRFGRSASLNGGGFRGQKGGLVRSLQILSRSKSTGSNLNPNPKLQRQSSTSNTYSRSSSVKSLRRSGSTKSCSSSSGSSSSSSSSSSYYYGSYNYHGNTGVRISPVLNVPPPYVLPKGSGGGNGFFGLGYLLCNGKEKNRRKKSLFSPPSP